MKKQPILIMSAMKSEADFLIDKLKNLQCYSFSNYKFYEGNISSTPIVIVFCNVMTINSAIATCIAIQKYNPIAIISQGTAGAHSKNIHRGDIVIGEKCINIMSCQTPAKAKNEGSNSLDWELISFLSDSENILEYKTADKKLIELCKKISYTDGAIHYGIIGSGDVWNKETDRILYLNKKYGTLCEDMESISIYTVANRFNIPVIGIRIISNNEILGEKFDKKLCRNSQEFVYNLILKMGC